MSKEVGNCWVVEWRSDWMTRPTRRRVLYQDKTSSIMTNRSCHNSTMSHHHHTIWWWVVRSNCYWIGPSLSPSICQVSITLFSSYDPFLLCFIILSHTLCHMPLFLLIFGLIPFPWRHFPFVSADPFIPMTHFISLTILPIILTLLLPLFLIVVLFMCCTFVEFLSGPLPSINTTWSPHQVSCLQLVHISRVLRLERVRENREKGICT